MSSLSKEERKKLNSIAPIYSNQKDTSLIATNITAPPKIETKSDLTKNISYNISSLLNKETGIDYGMKDLPFVLVSYYIEKDSYKPFLLFHVEETNGEYAFPEMDVNKEDIFDDNDMSKSEDEKTLLGQLLEQFLGTGGKKETIDGNKKDTDGVSTEDNASDDIDETVSDNNTMSEPEIDDNDNRFTNEILKSYASLTGLPEELSENNYKGYINTTNTLYFFFEHYELYGNNNHWATIDELLHQKQLYNGKVHETTTELFTQFPQATMLLSNKKNIEIPQTCYLANYSEDTYSTQYFEQDTQSFNVDIFTNTTSVPFFNDIYLFTSKQIPDPIGSRNAKRAVIFMNKAVHVVDDELTTEDVDILKNYNMICHEKTDNNYIIIQKDTLFYLLPL